MRVAYLIAASLITTALHLPSGDTQAAELYKWTDEQGRTHYSDKPPPGKEAETRAVQPVADSAPLPTPSKEKAARCAQYLESKRVLETFEKVESDLDGDGVQEMLTEEQKQAQLTRLNNLIERECKNTPPPVAAESAEGEEKGDSDVQIAEDRDYFADEEE